MNAVKQKCNSKTLTTRSKSIKSNATHVNEFRYTILHADDHNIFTKYGVFKPN